MKNNLIKLVLLLIIAFGLSNVNAGYLDDLITPINPHTCPSSRARYAELGADQWNFYPCQCTSYVAWKINQNGINFDNSYEGQHWGNAEHWDNAASLANISYDNTPRVGDAAVWDPWSGGAHAEGHVAYVESVNSDGSVNISEYNFRIPLGYTTRNNVVADHYIHLNGSNVEVYDFWIRDPNIPIYTNGAFDAQFKLRNNGVENIHYDAVALAIHNPDGSFNMDMMRENNVNLPFNSGLVEVTNMPSVAGNYTVRVKVNENGTWRDLSSQDITIVLEETPPTTGGDTWTTGAYSNNANMSQTLSISGASSLTVAITGETENGYDFIKIYDTNGTQVGRFSGNINESLTVSGSSIRAVLTSDGSVTKSGVTVSISSGGTVTPPPTTGGDTWTTGAYSNNANMNQTLSISGASSLTVAITGETESGYDFITIYDANGTQVGRFSGNINESLTVGGSSVRAVLTSDGSVTKSGVTVSIN